MLYYIHINDHTYTVLYWTYLWHGKTKTYLDYKQERCGPYGPYGFEFNKPWGVSHQMDPSGISKEDNMWYLPSGYDSHSHEKSPFIIGKPSINGPFSMAMLNNQRVFSKQNKMLLNKPGFFQRMEMFHKKNGRVSLLSTCGFQVSFWVTWISENCSF